jgi:hypothetical protein
MRKSYPSAELSIGRRTLILTCIHQFRRVTMNPPVPPHDDCEMISPFCLSKQLTESKVGVWEQSDKCPIRPTVSSAKYAGPPFRCGVQDLLHMRLLGLLRLQNPTSVTVLRRREKRSKEKKEVDAERSC